MKLVLGGKGKYDFKFGEPVSEYKVNPALTLFDISGNRFKELPDSLENTQLHKLLCFRNAIEKLPNIPDSIEEIDLSYNALKDDVSFKRVTNQYNNLTTLRINNNRITKIPLCLWFNSLTLINISNNFITEFNVEYPPNLVHLNISNNRIKEIPENYPPTLVHFDISINEIEVLSDQLMNCAGLEYVNYEGNPIPHVSEEILQFIDDRMTIVEIERERRERERRETEERERRIAYPGNRRSVYDNGQSVHASEITKSVADNIKALEKLYEESEIIDLDIDIIIESYLDSFESITSRSDRELLEYIVSKKGVHSLLNVTIKDVFMYVWHKVLTFDEETQREIANVLKSLLCEMSVVCFTGRISRLVNILSGFDDKILVEVDITTQIQAKYDIVKNQLRREGMYEDHKDYNKEFKDRFKNLLLELNLEQDLMDAWLSPFDF